MRRNTRGGGYSIPRAQVSLVGGRSLAGPARGHRGPWSPSRRARRRHGTPVAVQKNCARQARTENRCSVAAGAAVGGAVAAGHGVLSRACRRASTLRWSKRPSVRMLSRRAATRSRSTAAGSFSRYTSPPPGSDEQVTIPVLTSPARVHRVLLSLRPRRRTASTSQPPSRTRWSSTCRASGVASDLRIAAEASSSVTVFLLVGGLRHHYRALAAAQTVT